MGVVMPLLAGLQRWYAKHKLRQATIAGAGGSITAWPIATPRAELVPAAQAWLADRLATIRTPRGIDTCGLALKLVQQEGGRWHRLWSVQIPCFVRRTPQETYQALAQQILALPLADSMQRTLSSTRSALAISSPTTTSAARLYHSAEGSVQREYERAGTL